MKIRENEYLVNDNRNTIGNLDEICNIRNNNANDEYKKFKDKFPLEITASKNLESKLITVPKITNKNKVVSSRRSMINSIANTTTPPNPTITNATPT